MSYVLCYHDTIFGFPSEGLPDFSDVHEGLLDGKAGLKSAKSIGKLELCHTLAVGGSDLINLYYKCLCLAVGYCKHVTDGVWCERRAIHL